MDPLSKLLGAHPLGALLLLVLLALVWPDVLTAREKALAALTTAALGAIIALLLEIGSRIRRRGQETPARRQPVLPPARLRSRLFRPPHPGNSRLRRPGRATRKRA